jgi:hypothetical protein
MLQKLDSLALASGRLWSLAQDRPARILYLSAREMLCAASEKFLASCRGGPEVFVVKYLFLRAYSVWYNFRFRVPYIRPVSRRGYVTKVKVQLTYRAPKREGL